MTAAGRAPNFSRPESPLVKITAREKEVAMTKRWQYGVLVRSHDRIEYYGLAVTYLEAVELQRAAFADRWETATIFDTTLSEVLEPPQKKMPHSAVQ